METKELDWPNLEVLTLPYDIGQIVWGGKGDKDIINVKEL